MTKYWIRLRSKRGVWSLNGCYAAIFIFFAPSNCQKNSLPCGSGDRVRVTAGTGHHARFLASTSNVSCPNAACCNNQCRVQQSVLGGFKNIVWFLRIFDESPTLIYRRLFLHDVPMIKGEISKAGEKWRIRLPLGNITTVRYKSERIMAV